VWEQSDSYPPLSCIKRALYGTVNDGLRHGFRASMWLRSFAMAFL
jgi:hypothetical protein